MIKHPTFLQAVSDGDTSHGGHDRMKEIVMHAMSLRQIQSKAWPLLVALALCAMHLSAIAAETVTYFHLDALGSPVAATDAQGNVVWTEQYKPFGERLQNDPNAQSNSRWYTGHTHDEDTGLTYAGARYYDPVVGRFMATDPKDFAEGNLQSFNRYAYANNNPYTYIDPDGRVAVDGGLWYGSGITDPAEQRTVVAKFGETLKEWGTIVVSILAGEGAAAGLSGVARGGLAKGEKALDRLIRAAEGTTRSNGDIVVKGGRERAKELFRDFDNKGPGNREILRDETRGGRGVQGELSDGTSLRIRFKPDGSTRIQAGDKKLIFP